ETLAAGLWCGDIDLVVGALQPVGQYTTLVSERLVDDWIALIVRSGHPLARDPNATLIDALQARGVLPAGGTPTRSALTALLNAQRLPHPRVTVETSDPATIRGLLLESDLITAAAQRIFHHDIQTGALARLPFVSGAVHRSIGIIRRAPERASPGACLLMDELRAVGRAHAEWSSPPPR